MKCPRYYDSRMIAMSAAAAMAVASRLPMSPLKSNSLCNSADSNLVVNRLCMQDVGVAKALFSHAFPRSATHSWSRALGLNRTIDGYMDAYLPTHIQNPNLGCIAARLQVGKDEINTELVGALLLEFMASPIDINTTDPEKKDSNNDGDHDHRDKDELVSEQPDDETIFAYAAIDGIMNECRLIFHETLRERHGNDASAIRCGYVAWIAVHEQFRGAGVASALIRDGNKRLKESGCRYAVAFTMSPTSTKVFQKNGFERWGWVTYSEYELEGKRPFRILPDELSVMVCDLESMQQKQLDES